MTVSIHAVMDTTLIAAAWPWPAVMQGVATVTVTWEIATDAVDPLI